MKIDLETLAERIKQCSRCELRMSATQPVPGLGSPAATYFFLGEAPGHEEDRYIAPFIGLAGKRLDKLIALAKINPNECYFTNVCKCRPPKNREPRKAEIRACYPWLLEELKIIKPKYIVTLGRIPLGLFSQYGIKQLHGCMIEVEIGLGG